MSTTPRTPAGEVRGAQTPVRMGELVVSSDPGETLTVIGLGSCVALTIVCPEQKIAGVAHVVLPEARMAPGRVAPPGKFADVAVPELVGTMRRKGANQILMRAVLVGGSAMFGKRSSSRITAIGEQNVEALTLALGAIGIRLVAADVGGLEGRTIQVPVGDGRVVARTISGPERELFPAGLEDPAIVRAYNASVRAEDARRSLDNLSAA